MTMAISCHGNSYYYCYDYTNYVRRGKLAPYNTRQKPLHILRTTLAVDSTQPRSFSTLNQRPIPRYVCSHHHRNLRTDEALGSSSFFHLPLPLRLTLLRTTPATAIIHAHTLSSQRYSILILCRHCAFAKNSFQTFNNTTVLQHGSRAYTFIFRMFAPRVCLTIARAWSLLLLGCS